MCAACATKRFTEQRISNEMSTSSITTTTTTVHLWLELVTPECDGCKIDAVDVTSFGGVVDHCCGCH